MFRSEMAAHPITSNLTHRCVEALLSPDREMYLARILRELVPANYMSTPLGRVGECDLEKLLVQIIVNDLRPPPKEALFLCRQTSWAVVRALVQLMSVDGFAVFGTCDVSMENDGNASVTLKHTNSSAITSPICLCHSTGLIWFQIPSDYSRPFQWLVNNLSLKVSKLFFQPQNEGERCSGQMPNAKQVFKSKFNSSSMVFGTDAVHSFNLLSAMCHKCVSLTAAASDLDLNVTEGDCSFSSTCNCVEITDSDVQEIKRETKIEHEESCGSAMADPEEDSVVAVCEKHFNAVKRTRFQFNGSERMLIVQCPGCPAEFRGLKDRMCRLVSHIQTHGPKLCELYMKVIAKRYRPVFDIMKKRINFQKNVG